MHQDLPDWIKYRWVRPDGDRYLRHDAERFLKPALVDYKVLVGEHRGAEEKKVEVAAALAADRARENRQRRFDILKLKSDIAWLRFQRALVLRILALQRKANFNSNQPRHPKGTPIEGGRWSGGSGHSLGGPGVGHNQGPPLDPSKPPKEPPADARARNAIVKAVARYVARMGLGPAGLIGLGLELNAWGGTDRARMESYADPPKTMQELQDAISSPKPGYDIHHVAEKTSALRDGVPPEMVHGRENLVRIPTLRHWDINAWHSRPNDLYGGLTRGNSFKGKIGRQDRKSVCRH